MSHGLLLGKFMPPHAGHVYLANFAARFASELTIVVGTLAREPIPGALRFQWMRRLFPHARVLHLEDENPQDPSEHPDFWNIWRESLQRVVGRPVDYVFASEPYGARLAAELSATFVPLDLGRTALSVSGTAIRANPLRHFDLLPAPVRPYFARRVSIFGPESTGKSTLARNLAEHFRTVHVPELARTWLTQRGGEVAPEDMPIIARGQAAAEDALAEQANRVWFTDTDPLATCVWSETLFGAVAPEVRSVADARTYDLTLLLDVDVPWVPDLVRYLPDDRRGFFLRCQAALETAGRRTQVLRGSFEARTHAAIEAVEAMLTMPRVP